MEIVSVYITLSRLFIFAINDKISFDACTAAKASAEQCAFLLERLCFYHLRVETIHLVVGGNRAEERRVRSRKTLKTVSERN